MPSKIILKKSSVASKVPVAGDLDFGELAINYTDGKLYYKKADGTSIDSFSANTTPDSQLEYQYVTNAYPTIRPTLMLDFANTEQLDPRITFTRVSTATYFDQFGVMQTAASGVARFDHNPVTGESLGLLIEEQRTNLLTYSEQFDNAAWTKTNVTISANTVVAPDGTLTADKLVENTTADARHTVQQAQTLGVATYTGSFYAKAGERTRVATRRTSTDTTAFGATFDLVSGVVVSTLATTAAITPVGNGWYRCSFQMVQTSASSAGFHIELIKEGEAASGAQYTGDGTSGIYIWGAQLEAGAFSTSYIQTVASQVTRAADVAVMTGANFSSWYNQAQGTVFANFSVQAVGGSAGRRFGQLDDGTANNEIRAAVYRPNIDGLVSSAIINGGVTQSDQLPSGTVVTAGVEIRTALSYRVNSINFAWNGSLATTDTVATIPTVTTIRIGSGNNALWLNGTIRKLAYYPLAATSAQIQGLTS